CPARFVQYTFAWSVASSAPNLGFTLSSSSGNPVTFTPGGNAVYDVHLVMTSSTQRAEVTRQVAVSCADPVPRVGALSLASSSPGFAPATFFRDDTATLSASPTSFCFSPASAGYAFKWE